MRASGFALTEALVAVAIGGLLLSGLMALNVDFISLSRRAVDMGEPYRLGDRLERAAAGQHRCDSPGSTLVAGDDKVALANGDQSTDFLSLTPTPGGTAINGAASGVSARPVRIAVATATEGDGKPRGGWSVAAIESGDDTIAVIGLRCDLPEVCDYDTASGKCRGAK